jgi:alkylated DNA repair dioxygenase AlkB
MNPGDMLAVLERAERALTRWKPPTLLDDVEGWNTLDVNYEPPRPYHPLVLAIRKDLEQVCGCVLDVCFLNRYLNQSDHLGWHADDSPEMDDARPVVTVSLGAEREIWFRAKAPARIRGQTNDAVVFDQVQDADGLKLVPSIEKLLLQHGSTAIMAPGMQDTHEHRIPKASFQCGERISLTFRGYVNQE